MALYQRFKRQILSKVVFVRIVLVCLSLGLFTILYLLAIKPLSRLTASLPNHTGRTNFLLLGVSGGDREGKDLTDTIIFASLDIRTGDTVLISIPRDLWIPSLRAKINTAYHYGEERQPGIGGFLLAKSSLTEAIGQPVDFVVLIDFSGFAKAIDVIGGLDIQVDTSFIDSKFPIPGKETDPCEPCRYETISFTKGLQHMDGATALKFVRSRQAEGDEGTDFARSKRQEKLISAFKQKILSSPTKIFQLKRIFSQIVITDISSNLYFPLFKLGLKAVRQPLRSFSLSEPLLSHPPISAVQDYQWVLLTNPNVAKYVESLLHP
ncbi:MAG: LCP family protein [Patescibacteria group bacterium]